jgi:ATP-dependent DNA ligase
VSYIVHKAIEMANLSDKALAAITENTWVISPKYDGCHAIFCFDAGKHVATYSRSGELVTSMPHIAQSLLDLYPIAEGRLAICGEAWIVGEPFNVVSGAFRRHAPQPQLQFVPFDLVPFDYNDEQVSGLPVLLGQSNHRQYPASYLTRITNLVKMRNNSVVSQVLLPRFDTITGTLTEALFWANGCAKFNKQRTDSFFDGAVLAQAHGKYIVGAGKGGEFIKVKPLLSETVKVTAVISDIGGRTGKNTCVLCFDLDGQIQKVSTGLTQAQADEYTMYPENIIGKHIEVEAMGRTANDLLREPRFKGIRTDV